MKDALLPLRDMEREIEFLESVSCRHQFESFRSNGTDIRAVSYALLVISEAARRVPDAWLAEEPTTPWHAIRAVGNKLRHEYHGVSDRILWDIVVVHIPPLRAAVARLMHAHRPPPQG